MDNSNDKKVVPPTAIVLRQPSHQSNKSSKPAANNHPLNGGNSISSNKDAHSVQL